MTKTVYTVRDAAEILGYIPHALGFRPRQSLVALTLQGNALGATLRVDLPEKKPPQGARDRYLRCILDYLRHHRGSDGTLLALYSDRALAQVPSRYDWIIEELAELLEREHRPLRELWLVGKNRWTSTGCRTGECEVGQKLCRGQGHKLEDVESSLLATELILRGSAIGATPGSNRPQRVAEPCEFSIERLKRCLELRVAHEDPDAFAALLVQVLREWDAYLNGHRNSRRVTVEGRDGPAAPVTETMMAALEFAELRDAIMVLSTGDLKGTLLGALAVGYSDVPTLMPLINDIITEPLIDDPDDGPYGQLSTFADRFGGSIIGQLDGGPDWDRVDVFAAALRADEAQHSGWAPPGLLSVLAWIYWCRGCGSESHAASTEALERDPKHRFASLMRDMVAAGLLCDWAADPATSWRR